jgi:hypothetical protein
MPSPPTQNFSSSSPRSLLNRCAAKSLGNPRPARPCPRGDELPRMARLSVHQRGNREWHGHSRLSLRESDESAFHSLPIALLTGPKFLKSTPFGATAAPHLPDIPRPPPRPALPVPVHTAPVHNAQRIAYATLMQYKKLPVMNVVAGGARLSWGAKTTRRLWEFVHRQPPRLGPDGKQARPCRPP